MQYYCKLQAYSNNPTTKHVAKLLNPVINKPTAIFPFGTRMKTLSREAELEIPAIATVKQPEIEPWLIQKPIVHFHIHSEKKCLSSSERLKIEFHEFLVTIPEYIQVYTDGSKDSNGTASAAIMGANQLAARLPNCASIFTAEIHAILLALRLIEKSSNTKFMIFSDSLSSLQAIIGSHCRSKVDVLDVSEKLHRLSLSGKSVEFCWIPSHVGIKGNETVDFLAKRAITEEIDISIKVNYQDLFSDINRFVYKSFQNYWNSFTRCKIYPIKNTVGETPLPNNLPRRTETTFFRLRIGHTSITHRHLLEKKTPPQCNLCQCSLSVEHILTVCPNYGSIRSKCFHGNNVKEILHVQNISNLIKFAVESGLSSQI